MIYLGYEFSDFMKPGVMISDSPIRFAYSFRIYYSSSAATFS
jgi:hypothetical protein